MTYEIRFFLLILACIAALCFAWIGLQHSMDMFYEPSVGLLAFLSALAMMMICIGLFSVIHQRRMKQMDAEIRHLYSELKHKRPSLPDNVKQIVLRPASPNTDGEFVVGHEEGQIVVMRRRRYDKTEEHDWNTNVTTKRVTEEEHIVMSRPGTRKDFCDLMDDSTLGWNDLLHKTSGNPSPTPSKFGERGATSPVPHLKTVKSLPS